MRRLLLAACLCGAIVSMVRANDLYFLRGQSVLKWTEGNKKSVTIWTAQFEISDICVSQDGQAICFTRSTGKRANDPKRAVGIYSLADEQITMINSGSGYNYGAVFSPNGRLVAFNYLPGHDGWKAAVYDRLQKTVRFNVAAENVFGWRTDSLLLFARGDGVVQRNLYDSSVVRFALPDSNLMGMSFPGTTLSFLSDSMYFFKCEDESISIRALDGPPENVFVVRNGRAHKIIDEKIDVRSSFVAGNSLYVDYTDYTESKKGKQKLLRYDVTNDKKEFLTSIGLLVGAVAN
jgi:hypothetical protein